MNRAADLALEAMALDEAALREQVAALEADVIAYRELAIATLGSLHDVTRERDRLRADHFWLIDEYRALRGRLHGVAA